MVKIISVFFDYIYYRLAKLYFKTDGARSLTPLVLITLVQIFIFIDIISLINFEVWLKFVSKERLSFAKWVYAIVYFLLLYLNYRRYKDKFEIFNERWNGESKRVKIIKGSLILLFLISVIAFSGILLSIRNS